MFDLKEFAKKLNGCEYCNISPELISEAKDNGIVIIYGASDDLCELDGALYDEFDCYNGGTAYLNATGDIMSSYEPGCKYITAKWCAKDSDGFAWTYATDISHENFEMFDEGDKYCRGFVFFLKELA